MSKRKFPKTGIYQDVIPSERGSVEMEISQDVDISSRKFPKTGIRCDSIETWIHRDGSLYQDWDVSDCWTRQCSCRQHGFVCSIGCGGKGESCGNYAAKMDCSGRENDKDSVDAYTNESKVIGEEMRSG